jgi:hypothetical protein
MHLDICHGKKVCHGPKASWHMVKKAFWLNYGKNCILTYVMVKKVCCGQKASLHMVKNYPDLIMVKIVSWHM